MKRFARNLVFSYIAVVATDSFVGGFEFGSSSVSSIYSVVLALALLYTFMTPILKITSMATAGISFVVMHFLLTLTILYVLTLFIPAFEIKETIFPSIYVLPQRTLTVYWSLVVSALFVSFITVAFGWLCGGKK